ncbi:hypothetical protein MSG28_010971 [Choristoneura fumiferana]|uniref:Uncharacterized protein n=1 Tax=Choristoneura fumiferana TaxID=7141 RepID=A0ACC0KPV3_CHOFU|nr:hypothetical protein MSG28_010971 [Choristoneura fumiferana]
MMDRDPDVLSDTGTNCNLAASCDTNLSENNQARLESLEKKAVHLRLVLEKDFKAADIKWSMFVSAAFSFRYESCLRPFPPAFMKNGIKDMDELLSVITDVPALDLVLQHLDNLENLSAYSDIIDLLFYVLVRLKEPCLKALPLETNTMVGNGVYLSSELAVSLPYSHGGFGWGASCIGGHLSCVALCEVIDAPDGINYHRPIVPNEGFSGDSAHEDDKKKVKAEEHLPTSHYIVTNCDLIKVYTKSSSLTPVEVFFGVPYAAYDSSSPGANRFAAPKRHPGWSRTLFAHRMPARCPQLEDSENDNFSEDCLFLNIWTPRRADGSSLPVMIILYSESWLRGGVTLPCQELAAEGVVVVTVAYRLHALAFFTLGSIAARGNLALLDQYLALLWVRENIAAFGGDPATITLLGHSAGADSVLHHIASPRALGLFQRAIVMSPHDIWRALGEDVQFNATDAVKVSHELARSLGCTSAIDQEILRCIRTRPLSDIVALYSHSNWTTSIRPVPDNFLSESQYYLPTSLSVALSDTKQPIMQLDLLLGTTDLEAINIDGQYDELLKRGAAYVTEYADTEIIPKLLRMFSLDQSEAVNMLAQAVHWEYWGANSRKDDRSVMKAVEAAGRAESAATWGAGGALLAARLARRVSRLYVYRYSQPAGTDVHGRLINYTGNFYAND